MERPSSLPLSGALREGAQAASEGLRAVPLIKRPANYLADKLESFAKSETKDPIADLVTKYGNDFDEAASEVRDVARNRIEQTKASLGDDIGKAITSPRNQMVGVPVDGAIKEIDDIIINLPVTAVKEKQELLELKAMLDNVQIKRPNGEISLKEADYIKSKLQQAAEPMYQNGALVKGRDSVARGAKQSARVLRKAIIDRLERAGDKSYANAYKLYEYLHEIQRKHGMKELLNPDGLSNKWYTAGAGESNQALSNVKRLDKWLKIADWKKRVADPDLLGGSAKTIQGMAEDLGAYKYLGNPSLLPVDTTGKAVARQYLGGAIGSAAKGALGFQLGGPLAGLTTIALTSPKTVKMGANILKPMLDNGTATYLGARYSQERQRKPNFANRISRAASGTKYEQVFRDAANKGEDSFNSTFFKTYLTDPEFQERYKQVDENSSDIEDLRSQLGGLRQSRQSDDLEDLLNQ